MQNRILNDRVLLTPDVTPFGVWCMTEVDWAGT